MSTPVCDVLTKIKINTDLKPPKKYSVIIFNDEVTSAAFVVQVLMEVFGFSQESAITLTTAVDQQGSGVAASGLTKELASHLRDLVIVKARNASYPLIAEIKEDE